MDKPSPRRRALVLHAGIADLPEADRESRRRACLTALEVGRAVLLAGGEAIDAVHAAIRAFEGDATVACSRGRSPTGFPSGGADSIEAGLMDGRRLTVGAASGMRYVAHPIDAARVVLRSPHVLLVGAAADALLVEVATLGLPSTTLAEPATDVAFVDAAVSARAFSVGAVAVDAEGGVAAGCSAWGGGERAAGRVGSHAVPGAGFCADHLAGGAVASGTEDALLRHNTARRAIELAREGHNAIDAAWLAVREFEDRYRGRGGLVLLGRDGTIGYAFNTPHMAIAFQDDDMEHARTVGFDRIR